MSVQIGKRYIGQEDGAIVIVTAVIYGYNDDDDIKEFVKYDFGFNTNILPLHKFKRAFLEIVEKPEPNPGPFAAVKAAYPTAKWIAQDQDGSAFVYLCKPRLDREEWASAYYEILAEYIYHSEFPEVYTHLENIPWNKSLTAL